MINKKKKENLQANEAIQQPMDSFLKDCQDLKRNRVTVIFKTPSNFTNHD